jgi:CDP-diacylglycerol--glycerol-3-phosphate 3-phosphatidyltransferase
MVKRRFNLPTRITLFRLAMIPILVILFFIPNVYVAYALFFLYIIAVSTDKLDGYLARRNNMVTPFGAFLDPLVDKMLVHVFFILLAVKQILPAYLVVVIFARDLTMNSLRDLAKGRNVILPCPWTSKLKALLQVFVVGAGLLFIPLAEQFGAGNRFMIIYSQSIVVLMWITVLFSLYALFDFFAVKKHRDVIFEK